MHIPFSPAPLHSVPVSNLGMRDQDRVEQHYGYFEGKFNPQAVTTLLEGENAIFFVPVVLHLDPA